MFVTTTAVRPSQEQMIHTPEYKEFSMPTLKQILGRKAERDNLRQLGMTVVLVLALVVGAFTLAFLNSGLGGGPVVQELSGGGDGALSNEFRF